MRLEWGQATRPLPGMVQCGDAAWLRIAGDSVRLAVMDGLGHGPEAALASEAAMDCLKGQDGSDIEEALGAVDRALAATRGVAMSLADLDLKAGRLSWVGVGNVQGLLLRPGDAAPSHESLLQQSGIVGCRLPRLHRRDLPLRAGDRLLFYTDGLLDGLVQHLDWRLAPQDHADALLRAFAKATDDALVWVGHIQA